MCVTKLSKDVHDLAVKHPVKNIFKGPTDLTITLGYVQPRVPDQRPGCCIRSVLENSGPVLRQ